MNKQISLASILSRWWTLIETCPYSVAFLLLLRLSCFSSADASEMIKFWRSFDCEINFQGRDVNIVKGEISRHRDRFNLSIRRFCTDKYIPRAFSLVKSNGWLLLPLELVTRWKVSYFNNNNDSLQSSHAFLFSFLIFYLWEGRNVNKIRIINCVSIRYGCYRYREIFAPTIRWFRFCFAMNECSFHWNNTYCRSKSVIDPYDESGEDVHWYRIVFSFSPPLFLSFFRFDTRNCKLIILVKFHNISSIDG